MISYTCDVCGTTFPNRADIKCDVMFDAHYDGRLMDRWKGDICPACLEQVEYEAGMAALAAIANIRESAKRGEDEG